MRASDHRRLLTLVGALLLALCHLVPSTVALQQTLASYRRLQQLPADVKDPDITVPLPPPDRVLRIPASSTSSSAAAASAAATSADAAGAGWFHVRPISKSCCPESVLKVLIQFSDTAHCSVHCDASPTGQSPYNDRRNSIQQDSL